MNPTSLIGIITFAPAIFVLYKVMGDYDPYFKHNKAFFMIALGLLVGLIVGLFTFAFPFDIFMVTLAVVILLELIKFVVLLSKPFRLKHDATFYGISMGVGMVPMMLFIYFYFAGLTELHFSTALFMFLISVSYTFVHSSTGAYIGYGCYVGEFWRYFIKAVIISGIHGLMMSFVWGAHFSNIGNYAILIIAVIYSVMVLLHIVFEIIPKTVPKELKQLGTKKV